MGRNIGTVDRAVRVVLGVVLLSLTLIGPQTMWGLLGVIPLITGLWGYCPLYAMLGLNTWRPGTA